MKRIHKAFAAACAIVAASAAFAVSAPPAAQGPKPFDLVVYGGTPAGISAAVQAKRMGLDVVLIEPTGRIGGLTTGGLGRTDIGDKEAYGGITREFYEAVAAW